jgi:biopolymer transport protein ExbD
MDVGGSKAGVKSEINLTPLIDVVLVLLIIFMVLTPSMLKHMTANVPRKADANTPPPPPGTETIIVAYRADRTLSINHEPIAPEALADKITEKLKHDVQKVVFFQVDDDALYGEVVKFMDIVRGAGAKVLGIVTKEVMQEQAAAGQ